MSLAQLDWAAARVRDATGFDDAFRVLEVGGGDLSRGIALSAEYQDKEIHSSDYELNPTTRSKLAAGLGSSNFFFHQLNVCDTYFLAETFDFIFSVALMEHVAEIDAALEEVYRILRPGGIYYFIQAPFWSCAQGHHFRHWDDTTYEAIPAYGHLYLTKTEMEAALRERQPPFEVTECLAQIYERPDLSRLTRNQTFERVAASRLDLLEWEDYDDRRWDAEAAERAHPHVRYPVALEEMRISGAYVTLRRPATP